jgi:hypothetical protein
VLLSPAYAVGVHRVLLRCWWISLSKHFYFITLKSF